MSIRYDIERFHLLFCKTFLTAQDKSLIVLKGGCNLRFFLGSSRYSEDIDFDVQKVAKETLKKRVDKVLSSQVLRTALAAAKLDLVSYSSPKQTETVQRWKVALQTQGQEVPSKIEFSRRGIDETGSLFEVVDPQLSALHRMTPTFMAHYGPAVAIAQKVEVLAGRPETQARDVFDLAHLFSRFPKASWKVPSEAAAKASEALTSVDFDQFRGQVVEFLEGDARSFYDASSAWQELQATVSQALEQRLR